MYGRWDTAAGRLAVGEANDPAPLGIYRARLMKNSITRQQSPALRRNCPRCELITTFNDSDPNWLRFERRFTTADCKWRCYGVS